MYCLRDAGAHAHVCVHYPTGRKKLEAARARGLEEVLPRLLDDGAETLLIEGRGTIEDARDRAVILDVLNRLGHPHPCEHLIQADDTYYDRLRDDGVLDELIYVGPA